jgi:hypothetical protein
VGQFYRPLKHQLTLRSDADVLDWFKLEAKLRPGLSNANQSSSA